jgi:hypothetical protein
MFNIFSKYLIRFIKVFLYVSLLFSMTGCGVVHHRSVKERKRGLMILENPTQKKSKKRKRIKIPKKKHGKPTKIKRSLNM